MTPSILIENDPWLEPYRAAITDRAAGFSRAMEGGSLRERAQMHQSCGIHFDSERNIFRCCEFAPRAESLALIGDFNHWNAQLHQFERIDDGYWELLLPVESGFGHLSRYKIQVKGANGIHDRLSPFTRYALQDRDTHEFTSIHWQPAIPYQWRHQPPPRPSSPLIYEAHVGIATEQEAVGTYEHFRTQVLPRIANLGYNTIQLMAIAEHPYYGSFGYHVANYFAPSSRFGSPDELKSLIDEAHGLGMTVLLDLVHSHTVKNFAEGLREFDGSRGYLLMEGEHPQWDSLLFDYQRSETTDFLLSNLSYWLEEFCFDGFRFDGVTSMLYHHHGEVDFDHYDKYFYEGVHSSAITYLQIANTLIREVAPHSLTIAEDFSGIPGCCATPAEGGLGFDYRLGMGIPDYWIKLLKHCPDEDWDLQEIWSQLSNRRAGEKTISYTESHDQALVGDKTLAFWLMDQDMYWHMSKESQHPNIDRGLALHKILRLLTFAVGGEAWLNFIGNEFGHPEWLDFPREGNGWSYQYARRQWSLADNRSLKYQGLQQWEAELLKLASKRHLLEAPPAKLLNLDQENLCLQFERADLVFAINLHPSRSIPNYRFSLHVAGTYRLLCHTDQAEFEGLDRLQAETLHHEVSGEISIYLPSRCGLIFERVS